MTVTDTQLNELAKALKGDAYTYPQYASVGTGSVSTIETTATAITGEIDNDIALTAARTNNQVSWTGLRSGADVLDTTNGDSITNAGALDATSGGTLHFGAIVAGVTHTTAFDLEFVYDITVNR